MSLTLYIHVAGAAVGLLAGVAALAARKGSAPHRKAGLVFLATMLVCGMTAAFLAYAAGKWLDIFSGLLTAYFVLTAWTTLRARSRAIDITLLMLGVAIFVGYLGVEWMAQRSGVRRPDVPPGAGYIFAAVMAIAIIGDVRLISKGNIAGRARIGRHLWRMCFALFMATASFFLGRLHLFPEVVRASGAPYVLALAPLTAMAFWLALNRRTKVSLLKRVPVENGNSAV